jgi:hypothetical protein
MSDRQPRCRRADSFAEALAHWQLQVQTSVKKVSSLPTTTFDACDATLEAQLTVATRDLLQLLLRDAPPPHDGLTDGLQLEDVRPDELRRLRDELAGAPPAVLPDLAAGNRDEHVAILTDLAGTAEPAQQARALEALRAVLAAERGQ